MNYLDIIIGILIIAGFFNGIRKGFVHQLASLTALVLGIYLAAKFAKASGALLTSHFLLGEKISVIVSFIAIMILVMIGIHLLGRMIENILEEVDLTPLNRIAGGVFSLIKSILILSALFMVINLLSPNVNILTEKHKEKSFLYKPIASIIPSILPYFKTEKEKEVTPDSNKSI